MKAFLFPGQGSQKKGMGADVFAQFPQFVRFANDILGYDIERLCLEDPDGVLNQTEFTQPAVFIVSVLSYLRHLQAGGDRPDFVAGHSVGEYAALVASGALDFRNALRLVKARADVMARLGSGGLAAVIGFDETGTRELIGRLGGSGIEVANLNTPDQTVVGGSDADLELFVAACLEADVRAVRLRVSGAFHTSLMSGAAQSFRSSLENVKFRQSVIPCISNVTGRPYEPDQIGLTLGQQIDHPVNWAAGVEYLIDCGVEHWNEFPDDGPLRPMVKKIQASHSRTHVRYSPPVRGANAGSGRSFQSVFGCDHPIVFGGIEDVEENRRIVCDLKHVNMLACFEVDGRDVSDLEADIAEVVAVGVNRSSLGLGVSYDPYSPGRTEALIQLAEAKQLGWVQLRGFRELPECLAGFRHADADGAGRGDDHGAQRLRIIVRTNSAADFRHLMSGESAGRLDAVCLDVGQWRNSEPLTQAAAHATLAEVRERGGATGRDCLFGLSGTVAERNDVANALKAGFDFVVAESVFRTRPETMGVIASLPDWTLPEFGSRTLCRVADAAVAERLEGLDRLYRRAGQNLHEVDAVLSADAELALLKKELMPGTQSVRAKIRTIGSNYFQSHAIRCEPADQISDAARGQTSLPRAALSAADVIRHLTTGPAAIGSSQISHGPKDTAHEPS